MSMVDPFTERPFQAAQSAIVQDNNPHCGPPQQHHRPTAGGTTCTVVDT